MYYSLMECKLSYWQLHCVNLKINIHSEIYRHFYFKYGKIFRALKRNYLICLKREDSTKKYSISFSC